MWNGMLEKLKESIQSVLPISILVLLLHGTIAPMPAGTLLLFITGTVLLILGMSLFTFGVDLAIMPMGELIGSKLVESRKLWVLIGGSFLLGLFVTVAEPDLQVLVRQVPEIPDGLLIGAVAVGVAFFLVVALLRVLFQVRISYLLIGAYGLSFLLAAIFAPGYLAVAFDSGGVTTGPITVPFILALGAGVSAVRSGKSTEEDSFGLCGICSIGPVLAVILLGIFYHSSGTGYGFQTPDTVENILQLLRLYGTGMSSFLKENSVALLPTVLFFGVLQAVKLHLPKSQLIKLGLGLLYTLIGLTIFMTGVNIGFMPAGTYLGRIMGALSYNWILIPLGALLGLFVVAAEPAVHVLNKQVEDVTGGAISRRMMMGGLSVGVALALALAMVRILTAWSVWWFLLPGYVAALLLTLVVPPVFSGIAFDSGGVASGTMAAAFILPFAIGVSNATGGNVMTDAFGIVALVAMMPLVTVQLMGLLYHIKLKKAQTSLLFSFEEPEASERLAEDRKWNLEGGEADAAGKSLDDRDHQ